MSCDFAVFLLSYKMLHVIFVKYMCLTLCICDATSSMIFQYTVHVLHLTCAYEIKYLI